MIDKLTAAKNNLNGKATDFSKADELKNIIIEIITNVTIMQLLLPQLAYDNAINELKNYKILLSSSSGYC